MVQKLISRKRQNGTYVWFLIIKLVFLQNNGMAFLHQGINWQLWKCEKLLYWFLSFFSLASGTWQIDVENCNHYRFFGVIRSLKLLFGCFWANFWLTTVINWKGIRLLTRIGNSLVQMWLNFNWHWFLCLSKSHSSQRTRIFVKALRCVFDQPFMNGSSRKIAQHISTPWSIFHFSSVYSAQCSCIKVCYTSLQHSTFDFHATKQLLGQFVQSFTKMKCNPDGLGPTESQKSWWLSTSFPKKEFLKLF